MVSGCESDLNVSPAGTHRAVYNYGSRIDCYAWGEEAYSTYWSETAPTVFDDYRTFGGTSAAGAIIAGAAILEQDMAKSKPGPYLQPAQLRALLSDRSNGTSIVDGKGTQVGVMPDLVKVGQKLGALPDIYVRDSLLDYGEIPTAMLSQSPDIIVRSTQVANPELEFGRMGAFADAYVTNHMVQAGGAPNYLYVRMLNRTGHTATKARATVYWAPISPLILPSDWHLIGTSVAVPIPGVVNPGDPHTMVVAELPVWTPLASEFPPSGHACFVAVLDDPNDPAPVFFATPGASTVTDAQFAAALGRYNNAAFRNFTVSVTSSTMSASTAGDPADAWATQPPIMFHIRGLESRGIVTGFALEHDAPRDVKIEVELPDDLTSEVEFANARLKRHRSRGRAVIELDCDRRRAVYGSVPMPAGSRHPCVLRVRDSSGESSKPWHVIIRQHIEGRWVGALTFSFGAGDTPEGLR